MSKKKLAESALKREQALKNQRDTIEKKMEYNTIRALERKKAKEIEIEEQREKARLKKIQLQEQMEEAKYLEQKKRDSL